ncbi:MAG: hypothetical protein J6X88_02675 [Bacteroidales bacterium]|nr:hypothetical protein [Bacteroidales bacterium]
MIDRIEKNMQASCQLLEWDHNIESESRRQNWHRQIVDAQRDLRDMREALKENPSVAAYGESQMGKSFLVNAMLGCSGKNFIISDGTTNYDFKHDINPSENGAQNEATGVVTRFSRHRTEQTPPPPGKIRVKLLSIADIILILTEAWYNETEHLAASESDVGTTVDKIRERISDTPLIEESNPLVSEVDLSYIQSYARRSSRFIAETTIPIITFLRQNYGNVSREHTQKLLQLIWENNNEYNRLFGDLIKYRSELGNCHECYVNFSALQKKYGTLLDVERLNEMYGENCPSRGPQYIPDVEISETPSGPTRRFSKPFFSALTAEVVIDIDSAGEIPDRNFLNQLDILDFPGLKGSQHINDNTLHAGNNLATVYRRGKVTYLFSKYSQTELIGSLLFCQNHNDYHAGKLGGVLKQWVETNVGSTPETRKTEINRLKGSPLLIVSTYFNQNLDYYNESEDADLDDRWRRRFDRVLSDQVLKSLGLPDHWFNSWDGPEQPFREIFLMRDFEHSTGIFKQDGRQEGEAFHPDYLARLKESFLSNKFVKERFKDAAARWDGAATPNNVGTEPILSYLNTVAPNMNQARQEKFRGKIDSLVAAIKKLIAEEYHDDDPAEDTKKAKKKSGSIIRGIDAGCGTKPWFFCNLMQDLTLPESTVRRKLHACLNSANSDHQNPLTGPEASIYISAGLSTKDDREKNLHRLLLYCGVDTEDECRESLKEDDIKMDHLLSLTQVQKSIAEKLVEHIEQVWRDNLSGMVVSQWAPHFNAIGLLASDIYELWTCEKLNAHKKLTEEVDDIMNRINEGHQVGIVANWIAMQLARFTAEMGYSWITSDTMEDIKKKNNDYSLNIDFEMSANELPATGVEMLGQISEAKRNLLKVGVGYTSEEHKLQSQIPDNHDLWQWENRLRIAEAILSGVRKYDEEANRQLGEIKANIY